MNLYNTLTIALRKKKDKEENPRKSLRFSVEKYVLIYERHMGKGYIAGIVKVMIRSIFRH